MRSTDIWDCNRNKEGKKGKKKGRERERQREREREKKEKNRRKEGGKEGGEREGRPSLQSAHLKPLHPSHQWKMNSPTLVAPL